ncbi:MAG: cytochrome P450, partial [Janthinobacterium lividum]
LPLLDALLLNDPKPPAYLEAWEQGKAFCREQQALARRGECNNLVGLIANSVDGGQLDDDEMMAMMVVLLIGGVSTLAGAAAACLLNLAQNPDIAARIREEPHLADAHLEESLRLDPPVSLVLRFAVRDVEIGGRTIPAGMPVYAMIAVACHDPATFPDPYRFDPTRTNAKAHLAFGHGIHTCIGNTVTRMIAPLIIRKVAARFPDLRQAGGDSVVWDVGTPRARHLKHLMLSV